MWLAVDKTDHPRGHRSPTETRLVPVVLTLVAPEDIPALAKGTARGLVTQHIIAHIHQEADDQGAVLAETDTALLLAHSAGRISDYICHYEKRTDQTIPRRATVHELGPSASHKTIIARKRLLERTASETNHLPGSLDRYLLDSARCYVCLKRAHQPIQETAFTTGLSCLTILGTFRIPRFHNRRLEIPKRYTGWNV